MLRYSLLIDRMHTIDSPTCANDSIEMKSIIQTKIISVIQSTLFTLIVRCWNSFNSQIVIDSLSATLPASRQTPLTYIQPSSHMYSHHTHTHKHRPSWTCFTRFCFDIFLQHCLLYWVALSKFVQSPLPTIDTYRHLHRYWYWLL